MLNFKGKLFIKKFYKKNNNKFSLNLSKKKIKKVHSLNYKYKIV